MPIVELDINDFAIRRGTARDISALVPGGKQAYVEPVGDGEAVRNRLVAACMRLRRSHGWRYSIRKIEYGGQTCIAVWRLT